MTSVPERAPHKHISFMCQHTCYIYKHILQFSSLYTMYITYGAIKIITTIYQQNTNIEKNLCIYTSERSERAWQIFKF